MALAHGAAKFSMAGINLDNTTLDSCIKEDRCAAEYNLSFAPSIPVADPLGPGLHSLAITSNNIQRSFLVYVPRQYHSDVATSLLFVFHGFSNSPECTYTNFGLEELSENNNIVTISPQGRNSAWNAGDCCFVSFANDVLFFRDMVAHLSDRLNVQQDSVYTSGYSNGGYMSYRLACEASDLVAGIFPVAGALSAQSTFSCTEQAKPVPVIHFHGTSDGTISYSNAVNAFQRYPALAVNGCSGSPVETFLRGTARCEAFTNCNAGAYMELCTLTGMGHAWPGAQNYCSGSGCGCAGPDRNIDVLPYAWEWVVASKATMA